MATPRQFGIATRGEMMQLYDRGDDPQAVDGKGQTAWSLRQGVRSRELTVRKRTERFVLRSRQA